MKGKVKFFDKVKGFGFITGEDGTDYFVHFSGLDEGIRLFENDNVEFDLEQGRDGKGPKAIHVRKEENEGMKKEHSHSKEGSHSKKESHYDDDEGEKESDEDEEESDEEY